MQDRQALVRPSGPCKPCKLLRGLAKAIAKTIRVNIPGPQSPSAAKPSFKGKLALQRRRPSAIVDAPMSGLDAPRSSGANHRPDARKHSITRYHPPAFLSRVSVIDISRGRDHWRTRSACSDALCRSMHSVVRIPRSGCMARFVRASRSIVLTSDKPLRILSLPRASICSPLSVQVRARLLSELRPLSLTGIRSLFQPASSCFLARGVIGRPVRTCTVSP